MLSFGRDGEIRKEADLGAFTVIWVDEFQRNETFSVAAEELAAYCAQLGMPTPSEIELQEVMKRIPSPSRVGGNTDWARRACRAIEEMRKEAAPLW